MLDNQVECPVVHRFGPGIYKKEVTIPADSFAIGHKKFRAYERIFKRSSYHELNEDGSTTEFKSSNDICWPAWTKKEATFTKIWFG